MPIFPSTNRPSPLLQTKLSKSKQSRSAGRVTCESFSRELVYSERKSSKLVDPLGGLFEGHSISLVYLVWD